jgi:predicted dinucleotide-binding enzyme
MEIGIIGSGHIGSTLALHLAALGHWVSIANSRGPASLAAVAADIGATAATVEQAARAPGIVIIAVPEKSVPRISGSALRGACSMLSRTCCAPPCASAAAAPTGAFPPADRAACG